ncbi:MAG: adenylate/guanylate cyclase domain-containing protein [Pseudomonadota bacterium]
MQDVSASGAEIEDEFHIFLYRDLTSFGEWTVGVYFNTSLTGSEEYDRLVGSLWVGVAVWLVAIAIAAQAGRRLSKPVQDLAQAALTVQSAGLDAAPRVAGSRIRELDDAARAFNQMVLGLREREVIRRTLGRFVPEKIAQSLLSAGGDLAVTRSQATILFCDLEGFTALTEEVGPNGIMTLLNEYFEDMVSILERHNGVVTQFQGDAILATFNVPAADPLHASRALHAALDMLAAVESRVYAGRHVRVRIGINTGPVVAGAVGASGRLSYTVHGDAVNLAARLESLNKELSTRILVSGHTAELVDGFELRPAGETTVRGQSHPIALFELKGVS